MKTSNKILIITLGIALLIITYFILKISSFLKIDEFEMSGLQEKVIYDVNGIQNIEVRNGILVKLSIGETESLIVEADSVLKEYIQVEQSGDKLLISMSRRLAKIDKVNASLSVKALESVTLSGGARVEALDTLSGESLKIDCRSGSSIKIPIDLQELNCSLMAGTVARLEGSVERADISAIAGSIFEGKGLLINDVKANSTGGANIHISVTESLDATAIGGANISYNGEPKITNVNVSGGGNLIKVNR